MLRGQNTEKDILISTMTYNYNLLVYYIADRPKCEYKYVIRKYIKNTPTKLKTRQDSVETNSGSETEDGLEEIYVLCSQNLNTLNKLSLVVVRL